MFKRGFHALALPALLLLVGGAAYAQGFTVTLTFDENGHGTLTNSAGFIGTLPSSVRADPGPGGLPSVLFYDMLNPPGLTQGDLLIHETTLAGPLSDILRFNSSLGGVFVYSDNTDGFDAIADVGFPGAAYTNTLNILEVGPEGNNGVTYTPIAGQPGFVTGAGGPVTYVFTSDAVPEPAAAMLIGGGLIGLGVVRRLFKRCRG